MFIREINTRNRKTGKVYVKHALMASRLTDKGPRQHTVMQLGQLSLPKDLWKQLARLLENRLSGQETLFAISDPEIEAVADRAMVDYAFLKGRQKEQEQRQDGRTFETIDTASLSVSKARSLGPVLLACEYWKRLGFDAILRKSGISAQQRALAQAVIIGRLVCPGSELATWKWFRENTALPELLGEDIADLGKNPFYEISDTLLAHKENLEAGLWQNQQKLFNHRPAVFLYDLTNTYFEGMCLRNPLAMHGHSKEQRNDCRLVSLALVVDEAGLPVYSRIYRGNQSEPQTLAEILREVYDHGRLDGQVKPTIIMDRGIATADNLRLIREMGLPYALIERAKHERKYADLFAACPEGFEHWEDSREQEIHLKKVSAEDGETRVLVKSICRARKERAMDILQKQRFTLALEKLRESLQRGRQKSVRDTERRLGRIQQRYKTAARHHKVTVIGNGDIASDLEWRDKAPEQERTDLEGTYVISTSHADLTAPGIWELYITLTRVENAFRSLKSDLGLRPVFHQTEDRTCAHLLIGVLAYHLMAAIENDLRVHGIRESWASVNATMNSLQRASINYIDAKNQLIELRVSTNPEPQHEKILSALDISNPLPRKKSIIAKMT